MAWEKVIHGDSIVATYCSLRDLCRFTADDGTAASPQQFLDHHLEELSWQGRRTGSKGRSV